jgi:hypothetical protein
MVAMRIQVKDVHQTPSGIYEADIVVTSQRRLLGAPCLDAKMRVRFRMPKESKITPAALRDQARDEVLAYLDIA